MTVFYNFSLTFTKLSILMLYLRILTFHYARVMTKLLLGIVLISQTFIMCVIFTGYIPLDSFWDQSKKRIYYHTAPWYWANAGMHLTTDVLIFLLPLPVVLSMGIRWRQKLALCLLFTFGFGYAYLLPYSDSHRSPPSAANRRELELTSTSRVVFVSAFRLAHVIQATNTRSADPSYKNASIVCLTIIEPDLAIVCACLTTLKPLVVKLFPRIFGSSRRSSEEMGEGQVNDRFNRPLTIGTKPSRQNVEPKRASFDSSDVLSSYNKSPAIDSDATFPIYSNVSFVDVSKKSPTLYSEDSESASYRLNDLEAQSPSPTRSRRAGSPLDEYHHVQEELAVPSSARVRRQDSYDSVEQYSHGPHTPGWQREVD